MFLNAIFYDFEKSTENEALKNCHFEIRPNQQGILQKKMLLKNLLDLNEFDKVEVINKFYTNL